MDNPLVRNQENDDIDQILVAEIKQGNRHSLEKLIIRHQDWVYNIALKMVVEPADAQDITQEVLVKIIY